jgi:hypothetical protein
MECADGPFVLGAFFVLEKRLLMIIRQANIEDAEGIAQVHVHSWRSTYAGIVSAPFLADLKVENRKKNWEWNFRNLSTDETIFVVVDEHGSIVGFASGGKSRSDEYEAVMASFTQSISGRTIKEKGLASG